MGGEPGGPGGWGARGSGGAKPPGLGHSAWK